MYDYSGASRGNGPSPILWNKVPIEVLNGCRPNKGFGLFEDFIVGPISTTSYWFGTSTAVSSGTYVDAGLAGGVVALTPDVEDKGIQIQGNAGFQPAVGRSGVFEARIKLTDVLQTDWFVGFASNDTAILASNPDEMFGIIGADGAATINYIARSDGSGSATTTGESAVDDTFVRVGGYFSDLSTGEFYVDGALTNSITSGISDEVMAPSICLLSGEASANILYVDWIYWYMWYEDDR